LKQNIADKRNAKMITTIQHLNMFRRARNNLTKCSFCERYGHDVLTCNDPQLNLMEDMLYHEKENVMAGPYLTDVERKTYMYVFIYRKTQTSIHSLNRWRSFAIRKCGHQNNYIDHLDVWLKKIVDYIMDNERSVEQSIFNSEFIAFDENDAVSYLMDNLIQYAHQNTNNYYNHNIHRKLNIKMEMDLDTPPSDENILCECGICYQEKKETSFVKLDCNHEFCGECFENIFKSNKSKNTISCCMCRNVVKKIKVKDEIIKANLETFIVST